MKQKEAKQEYREPKHTKIQRGEFLVDRYEGRWTPTVALRTHQSLCSYFQQNPEAFERDCIWTECDRDRAWILCGMLRKGLFSADLLLWDPTIGRAAQEGSDAFLGHVLRQEEWERKQQLWLFGLSGTPETHHETQRVWGLPAASHILGALLIPEVGGEVVRPEGKPQPGSEDGSLLRTGRDTRVGFCVALLFVNQDLMSQDYAAYYLRALPPLFIGQPITDGMSALFFAMWKFLQLPFVSREERLLPRPERRRLQKAEQIVPAIETVTLRKSHSTHGSSHTLESCEWSCSWLVRGHWRRLQRPRKADGAETTYVHPYVKGPEDKPFKAPSRKVYVVKR